MIRRRLLNGTSACTTSFVAEPKHFPDPFWRGEMFGWDAMEVREFQGLQPRMKLAPNDTVVLWKNYPQLVIR